MQESGLQVTFQIDPEARRVLADRIPAEQVLLNLIRSAIEAMQDGSRRELLISTRADSEPGMVEIRVADSGPGPAPAVSARMFQPFMTTKKKGTGVWPSI